MKYLLPLLFFVGCGEVGVKQKGESETIFKVELGYINDIKELCYDSVLTFDFPSEEARRQNIAECTLNNMQFFDIDFEELQTFNDTFCEEDGVLDPIPVENQEEVNDACNFLSTL